MHATRLSALACAALLGSSLLISCGDEEGFLPAGGNGGEGGDGGAFTPRGGETSGGSASEGGRAEPSAGRAGMPNVGPGGSSSGGDGGSGGEPVAPSLGEELSFCPRLTGLSKLSLAVEEAYIDVAIRDCRIAWLIPRKQDLIDMRNELISWNRRFWGCEGLPVETFPLVWGTPALSQGDADIAMNLYLTASKQELALSPREYDEMKAALDRLATPLVQDASLEPSQASCEPSGGGGGGEGGEGGSGGEAAGGGGVGP